MLLLSLIQIINLLIQVVIWLVIVQFVLSLLIGFNIVDAQNEIVAKIWRAINGLLEPLLAPVRRFMPDTRPMDFSPLVVILGLKVLGYLLVGLLSSGL